MLVATCGGADGAGAPQDSQATPSEESTGRESVTEVATFRSDLSYSYGRDPDAVRYTKTAEEEAKRRTSRSMVCCWTRCEGADLWSSVAAIRNCSRARSRLRGGARRSRRGSGARDWASGAAIRRGSSAHAARGAVRGAIWIRLERIRSVRSARWLRESMPCAASACATSDEDAHRGPCAASVRAA